VLGELAGEERLVEAAAVGLMPPCSSTRSKPQNSKRGSWNAAMSLGNGAVNRRRRDHRQRACAFSALL
jgi:hypothetical protein